MVASISIATTKSLLIALLLHLAFPERFIKLCSCQATTCIESEKQALLSFKEGLNDPLNHLSSWSPKLQENCCLWSRVLCNHNTSHVSELHLDNANLGGTITDSLLNLSSLEYLDLSYNVFNGTQFPSFIGSMKSLQHLNVSNSGLVGPLPIAIGSLSSLETLILDSTALSGAVYEAHFTNCSKLKILNATSTKLIFNFDSSWIPPFQLDRVYMSYTQVGPKFPSWLRTQDHVSYLYVAYSGVVDLAPTWFWKWLMLVYHVDLTGNQIRGDLTNVTFNSSMIRLSSNLFTGNLPLVTSNVRWLTVRNNSLSGGLSSFLCSNDHIGNNMQQLSLQQNNLNGTLTNCWENWQFLILINLAWNHFSGTIPSSLSSLGVLEALHLHRNNLVGDIPFALHTLTSLQYVNLEHNQLSGQIPGWIGESYSKLAILSLSANNFTGKIPLQLCYLSSLFVLGIANNRINGTIPSCLNNLTLMTTPNTPPNFSLDIVIRDPEGNLVDTFTEYIEFYSKGSIRLYDKTLGLIRIIDLSGNQLSGSIPIVLCSLKGLRFLNLSSNRLTGEIPKMIGEIESLESLDLSKNLLEGELPASMSKLSSIASLNVSYNRLKGRIPTSTQLQSFDGSSYEGNVGLCGAPTGVSCYGDESSDGPTSSPSDDDGDKEKHFDVSTFMGAMGTGFAIGFMLPCAFLIYRTIFLPKKNL